MARIAAADPSIQAALLAGDATAVDRSPELRAAFDGYLEKFGDRCVQELKLESIPLSLDPSPLVASIARTPADDAPRGDDPDARLSAMLAGHPVRLAAARVVVRYARARVRDRENLRFERTRVFAHARRVFLAMGRQLHALGALDDPRHVLDLTVGELLGVIEGSAVDTDPRGLAMFRQACAEARADVPDPPERLVVRGPVSWSATDVSRLAPSADPAGVDGDRSRKGTGCGAGIVTAVARVIHDPRTETLEPGQVLVARHTDPGWIAVFANASAIVVERGSLLSHSAIVARELGIPCVVGLKGATRWIADGEAIRVDGGRGTVEKAAP
jgi:pyruvate,water dikinase